MLGSRLTHKNPVNTKTTQDPELVHREFYNNSAHQVILMLQIKSIPYLISQNVPIGKEKIILPAFGFAYVTHGYYDSFIPTLPKYTGLQIHTNFGDCIGHNIKSQDQADAHMIKIGSKKK